MKEFKTLIEVNLDPGQTIYQFLLKYSLRGRIGFIFLWMIGVVSFNNPLTQSLRDKGEIEL